MILGFIVNMRGTLPLLEPEESRYAEIPRQMLESGTFIVPLLDGQSYLDKPPLFYWLVMLSYSIFGDSVWSARIVPSLIAALIVPVVYRWARHLGGASAGLMAAAIWLTMPDAVYRTPMLTMNGLLALATTAAAAFGQFAIRTRRIDWRWGTASALACALGVLAKGPVAIVLVSPLLLPLVTHRASWRAAFGAIAIYASLVVLVAGPWFAIVSAREPDFLRYFFWKHHVERTLTPFDHFKPFWFYLPQLLLGSLPWWPLAFAGIRRRFPAAFFPLLMATFAMAFFSFAGSKRPIYLTPVYPPLAVGLGLIAVKVLSVRLRLAIVFAMAIGQALFFLLWLPGYHHRFSLDDLISPERSLHLVAHAHAWPAAEFRRHERLDYLSDDALDQLAEPTPGHSCGILTSPSQLSHVVRILAAKNGQFTIRKNEVSALVIWSPAKSEVER